MLGVYTIVETRDYGWASTSTLGFGAAAVVLLAAFLLREARARYPLLPLQVFRSRLVAGANAIQVLLVAGMFALFFLGALYLQRVLGFSALEVGLGFLPASITIGALSIGFSARLSLRWGPRSTLVWGLVLIAAALAWFARAPVDGRYLIDVLPVMLLLGIGGGLAFPALATLAMSDATPADSGLVSGLINTTQQVGGALGLAVLVTLSSARTEQLLAAGVSSAEALTSGYRLAFLIGAGLVVLATGLTLAALPAGVAAEEPLDPFEAELRRVESLRSEAA
jgi:predicted MFS family arabinose efflux permease